MCNSHPSKPAITTTKISPTISTLSLCFSLSFQTEKPRKPTQFAEIVEEIKSLFNLSFPIVLTALLLYSRSVVSMVFLGYLGKLELASGSLAIAFANITGYSVLSGLSLGMEPLCSQAFGAQKPKLLSITLLRSILFLLCSCAPISVLWMNMSKILMFFNQDKEIVIYAQKYILFTLPDLISYSFIHPIRIYLRSQGITYPLTFATAIAAVLHLAINLVLTIHFNLGIAGIAISSASSNLIVLLVLIVYICSHSVHEQTWAQIRFHDLATGWFPLLKLAAPSCVSVCLEWWWYEIMIIFSGFLSNPTATIASMGILIQTTGFIYIFPSSLSFAASTRVGNHLGANLPNKARLSSIIAVAISGLMGISAAIFAGSMKEIWAKIFTGDIHILRLTASALPILGLCELGNCPQTVSCGVLRGCARPTIAARINLGAFYLVGMPIAALFAFFLSVGFPGLWLGLLSAQICCAGLMLYVVGNTDWGAEAQRAQDLTSDDELLEGTETDNLSLPINNQMDFEPLISIKVGPT